METSAPQPQLATPISGRTVFDVPAHVALCPYCQGPLILDVNEWETETGIPTANGCYVDCPFGTDELEQQRRDHFYMPYVYWLPVQKRVAAWAREHVRVAPEPPALPRGPLALSAGGPGAGTRGDWMQTATSRAFYPLAPEPVEIDLYDIASGLSRMCRYGGQIGRLEFYSVAEHCVLLSYAVPPELTRWALMHDASEAYLVDVPRPIKPWLDGYRDCEDRLMRAVAERFGLPWPIPDTLKAYDTRILQNERRALWAGPPPMPWATDEFGAPLEGIVISGWLPYQARMRFLARADELGVRAKQ